MHRRAADTSPFLKGLPKNSRTTKRTEIEINKKSKNTAQLVSEISFSIALRIPFINP